MYREIIQDFLQGFQTSVRIDLLYQPYSEKIRIQKLIHRVIKYNILIYLLPTCLNYAIEFIFDSSFDGFFWFIKIPLVIFSQIFHIIQYIEMVSLISEYSRTSKKDMSALNLITMGATISIYQLMIYLTTEIVKFLFYDRIYYLYLLINFFLLTTYHSFYCFNNIWQFHKTGLIKRISIHEKMWPYYLGYGVPISLVYFYSDYFWIMAFYNLYLLVLIGIPFRIKLKLPGETIPYPSINLSFFSYLTGFVIYLIKNLFVRTDPN